MHGLADQPELDHAGHVFDETRIRCAARSRQHRRAARHFFNRRAQRLDKGVGFGQEAIAGMRQLQLITAYALCGVQLLVDPRAHRLGGPCIIIANIEARRRFGRNDIGRRIADIEAGHFQIRGLEMRGALIQCGLRQRRHHRRQLRHRIFG